MNSLLITSDSIYQAPSFDKIRIEDYKPAFETAILSAKNEIDAIANNKEEPTFENTIEALEYSGRLLSDIKNIFFNLLEALSTPQMQELAQEISPMLTEYGMYISLNEPLFRRIAYVYNNKTSLSLAKDQIRLLENTYELFKRNGALLSEKEKIEFSDLSEKLSLLELKFSDNILAATNSFILHLENEKDLEGLPEYLIEYGAQNAKERGKSGWIFTLDYSNYGPFMKYSSLRNLREAMYRAYSSRAVSGKYNNKWIVKEIIDKRIKISRLLGYKDFAEYALEDRMAKNSDNVFRFMKELTIPSLKVAKQEVQKITNYAKEEGFGDEILQAWDFPFWAEKFKSKTYSITEETLKPYFKLENCVDALFSLAGKLYNLKFTELEGVPVYHQDVKIYDVKDENDKHLALFYVDLFPRASKRSGAWMTEFRGQYSFKGKDFRPFISIVANLSKPTGDMPSLLSLDEFTTLLHEFGHALHGILSKGRYPSLCGTNVARDFVELPSQIMENYAFEPEFLNSFAKHYITGETIPKEYLDKIVQAKNYLSGYYQIRQLQFCYLDMAWHTLKELSKKDVLDYEYSVLKPYILLPIVEGTAISTAFSHIFSGGYSAGYYSYKWAEVLEADAFSLFSERGIFNKETADSFRKNILERGSSEDENILYRNFRGHNPNPDALLKKLEII